VISDYLLASILKRVFEFRSVIDWRVGNVAERAIAKSGSWYGDARQRYSDLADELPMGASGRASDGEGNNSSPKMISYFWVGESERSPPTLFWQALITRLDTPPSIDRRHLDSRLVYRYWPLTGTSQSDWARIIISRRA
jgi:hypothetical protein